MVSAHRKPRSRLHDYSSLDAVAANSRDFQHSQQDLAESALKADRFEHQESELEATHRVW